MARLYNEWRDQVTAPTNGNGTNGLGRMLAIAGAGAAIVVPLVAGIFWIAQVSDRATVAMQEITDLRRQVNALESGAGTTKNELVAVQSSLTEIETQFEAADQIRNLMHANELRVESLLWQKTFAGTSFPTDNAYYPSIANRPAPNKDR